MAFHQYTAGRKLSPALKITAAVANCSWGTDTGAASVAGGNEQPPSNPLALPIAYGKTHWQIIEEEKGKFKGNSVKFGMYTTVSSQNRGTKMTFFRWFSLYSSGWL